MIWHTELDDDVVNMDEVMEWMEISLGPMVGRFQKLWDQNCNQKKLWDQIETFAKVVGLKLQQKKLWDQIETFAKVMGPKVHLNLFNLSFSRIDRSETVELTFAIWFYNIR